MRLNGALTSRPRPRIHALAGTPAARHIRRVDEPHIPRPTGRHPTIRFGLVIVGCLLLIVTPFVGVLPGPGGVVTFAVGMGLVLRNSASAKRCYVRLKRRWPRSGGWADWGMRRPSARRRSAAERARRGAAD